MNFQTLEKLCKISGPSGNEASVKNFILEFIKKEANQFARKPVLVDSYIQDCIGLVIGKPEVAIFAHMDTTGFMVRYENQLIPIGSPEYNKELKLVGEDSLGQIECGVRIDSHHRLFHDFARGIDRGTFLTFKPEFKISKNEIQSPYLDNRLGVWVALELARVIDNALIFFTCWEEHGGGSVAYLAKLAHETYGIRKALIADVTWVTDGIKQNEGVVISMKDHHIPRRSFIHSIINVASHNKINFQLEVEAEGSSDGGEIQKLPYPIDWCFIGPPVKNVHSKLEKVSINDVFEMMALYEALLNNSKLW